MVSHAFVDLLKHSENFDIGLMSELVASNHIQPSFLMDICACSSKPMNFAMTCALMFHKMKTRYPANARIYNESVEWFMTFCADFMEDAPPVWLDNAKIL